jgi:membrane carboxypeptidase/penicillin-binding protein
MFQKYLDYINNTSSPKICDFDCDFEPIGPRVREDMKSAGLVFEQDGRLKIAESQRIGIEYVEEARQGEAKNLQSGEAPLQQLKFAVELLKRAQSDLIALDFHAGNCADLVAGIDNFVTSVNISEL